MAYGYKRISVKLEGGVAFATMSNPPINIISMELAGELGQFALEVAKDDAVRAVVLRSDDPDFWLAHFDVAAISTFRRAAWRR